MKSLKKTLLFWFFILQLIIYPSLLGILYYKAYKTFYEQVDELIEELAEDVLRYVKLDKKGQISLEESQEIKELMTKEEEGFQLIDRTSGEIIARTALFKNASFSIPKKVIKRIKRGDKYYWNTEIEGKMMRAVALRSLFPATAASQKEALLVVALERKKVTYRLEGLMKYAIEIFALALVITLLATLFISNRTLLPLKVLSKDLDKISAQKLDFRLSPARQKELKPLTQAINSLLERIASAFKRERQLTADIAHELRTPLAGLRSLVEVSLRRPRSELEYQQTLLEAMNIIDQTQQMMENLLILAQIDSGQVSIKEEEVELRKLIDDCWSVFAKKAQDKRLRFENNVPPATIILTDKNKLQIIASNILSNACEYANVGGSVIAETEINSEEQKAGLKITNTGRLIPEDNLAHIFDRFWRGDVARTDSGLHYGLGLAIVKVLSEVLSIDVVPINIPPDKVCFKISHLKLAPH